MISNRLIIFSRSADSLLYLISWLHIEPALPYSSPTGLPGTRLVISTFNCDWLAVVYTVGGVTASSFAVPGAFIDDHWLICGIIWSCCVFTMVAGVIWESWSETTNPKCVEWLSPHHEIVLSLQWWRCARIKVDYGQDNHGVLEREPDSCAYWDWNSVVDKKDRNMIIDQSVCVSYRYCSFIRNSMRWQWK